jgi:hypothetical protein
MSQYFVSQTEMWIKAEYLREIFQTFVAFTIGFTHFFLKSNLERHLLKLGLNHLMKQFTPLCQSLIKINGNTLKIIGVLLIALALVHIAFQSTLTGTKNL